MKRKRHYYQMSHGERIDAETLMAATYDFENNLGCNPRRHGARIKSMWGARYTKKYGQLLKEKIKTKKNERQT